LIWNVRKNIVFPVTLLYVTSFKPNRAADAKLYDALVVANSSGENVRAIGLYYNPGDGWVYLFEPDLAVKLSCTVQHCRR